MPTTTPKRTTASPTTAGIPADFGNQILEISFGNLRKIVETSWQYCISSTNIDSKILTNSDSKNADIYNSNSLEQRVKQRKQ